MADLQQAKADPYSQLREVLDEIRAGMLFLADSDHHAQPMSPQIDQTGECIWFFANKQSDLVRELSAGGKVAQFIVMSPKQDYHASIRGGLVENKDAGKIDQFWSDVVAAWFEGRDDPDLTLLQFRCHDAAIWASTNNPVRFGWEIAKAAAQAGERPDVGVRTHVEFQ